MRWRKQGLVYRPSGELWWARSHAHLPTVDLTVGDVLRVYFTALDEKQRGRIGYVDLDRRDPGQILHVAPEPVLDLGEVGTFDDSGVVASRIVEVGGARHLYYHGFQRSEPAPYLLFTGLARAGAGGGFVRHARVPILDRTADEPYLRAAPYVVDDGGLLRMWYVSSEGWSPAGGVLHYRCNIRHATSRDGVEWWTHPHVCLAPADDDEYAVGRPCVLREGGGYRMWYSRRSFSALYRLGYAESEDGVVWERKDELAGLERSDSGWDSEMVCYPCVADVDGRRLLFYNGNGRGASGFGYAVLEG